MGKLIHFNGFTLWQTRVQLFGSEQVAMTVQGMIETNGSRKMIGSMKRDLRSL